MSRAKASSQETSGDAFAAVYRKQYRSLVRLAAFLLCDAATAEDIVQEAFIRIASRHLADPGRDYGAAYLRRTVINLTRSSWRRRLVARRKFSLLVASTQTVDESAYEWFEHHRVVEALRSLPRRQREVLVLRYYLDLTEPDTARALGISVGSVKTHAARALKAMRALLGGPDG